MRDPVDIPRRFRQTLLMDTTNELVTENEALKTRLGEIEAAIWDAYDGELGADYIVRTLGLVCPECYNAGGGACLGDHFVSERCGTCGVEGEG